MGKIENWSLTPGKTCSKEACQTCLKQGCYAMKAYRMYPSVRKAWDENTELATNKKDIFFKMLLEYFIDYKKPYFRIHQAGDFTDIQYMATWFAMGYIAKNTRFMGFTKQFDILTEYVNTYGTAVIPKNVKLYLSAWTGSVPPENLRKHFPVAWLAENEEDAKNYQGYICPGSCENCKYCYEEGTKDVIFIKH